MTTRRPVHLLGVAIVWLLLSPASSTAQVVTGAFIGQVHDASGAVIPGAQVVANDLATGYAASTTTGAQGLFTLRSLPTGTYNLEVSASGFQSVKKGPLTLNSTEEVQVNVVLSPGMVKQVVTVSAQGAILQTQDSAVKSQVYQTQINDLPLNGRSPTELVLLGPSTQISRQASGGSSLGFTINGQNANGSNLRIDGTDDGVGTDPMYFGSLNFNLVGASLDAIEQYDIQTDNYSADVKGSSGYVNVITKSGTNQLHFDFYDFFRNGVMDARNFFQAKRGSLKLNDFGGSVGGPIKQEKVFYFVSFEGQRIRTPYPGIATVPTAAFDATVDPRLQVFIQNTPLPTTAIAGNPNVGTFQDNVLQVTTQDLGMARMDFNPTLQDRVFVQYVINDGAVTGAAPAAASGGNGLSIFPYYGFTEPTRHQTVSVDWTHNLSSALVSDLKLGENRYLESRYRGPKDISVFAIPVPSVPGMQIAGGGNRKKWGITEEEANEEMVWVKGKSTLSFGGADEYWRSGSNQFSVITMSFPSLAAFAADTPSGLSSTFGTSLTEPSEHIGNNQFALFVQESYRATPRLTLNVGLRYDNFGVQTDSTHHAENISTSDPFSAYTAPGASLYNDHATDFSPRAGFAWQPTAAKPFVLRGGFGLFYGARASGELGDIFIINNSQPFTISTADYANLSYPFNAGFYAFAHSNPGRTGFNPNSKDLYTEQWNLSGQYQFGQNTSLTVAYVGNHQVHIPGEYLPNVYDPLLGARPNPAFGSVKYVDNSDAAFYHSLQVSFRRHLSKNVAWDSFYTWSHAYGFETGSLEVSADVGFGNDQVQTYKNRNYNRGNMPFNLPNQFTQDFTYELPRLAGAQPVERNILGGWKASGVLQAATGFPFLLLTGGDTGDSTFVQRPNVVAGQSFYLSTSPANGFLNRAAFAAPTTVISPYGLKLGSMANNTVHMNPTLTFDFALAKQLYSGDKLKADFRAEAFNILNHPVFATPVATLGSSEFWTKPERRALRESFSSCLSFRSNHGIGRI